MFGMPAQTLGISHSYVSLTWICGPIAGFVVRALSCNTMILRSTIWIKIKNV